MLRGLMAAALLVAAAPAQAQDIAQQADAYMAARTDLGQFSGSVLVARSDEVLVNSGWGLTALNGERPDASTTWLAASLTKPVTAAAVLLLRDEGRLALSDSVCRFVRPCPDAWAPVTIEHLLRHTSGVPDYETALELGSPAWTERMRSPDSAALIVAEAMERPLDFAPGTSFAYSNTGYVLLARIIGAASGQSYESYVRSKVLNAAGMSDSWLGGAAPDRRPSAAGMTGRGEASSEELALGRTLDASWLAAVEPVVPGVDHGDAALVTTAGDMGRFATWFLKRFAADLDLIRQDELGADHGLGWSLTADGELAHNGILPGYVSRIVADPATGLVVVVLANLDAARFDAISRDLILIARGRPYEAPRSHVIVPLDPSWAEGLTGAWRMGGVDTRVVFEDGRLFLTSEGRFRAGLLPEGPDVYYAPLFEGTVTFTRDETGRATGYVLDFRGESHPASRAEP
ncbi:serine hydrolase domain-containing protein [Brevundimonas lenta]|uniref:CubicO group peptidase (Beta-lactamase class C family) n=1 Tax=Brevundimonas lenta TaxID=424796 RepID=A0A7W6JAS3_9CAUL|nr:serine hydrolase domain-containing protein [Brevundimonas lenta]MBB4081674.1 CubicO group peptidase (beta-lactamase class C family) [Brevundimonas lenta]